MRRIFLYSGVVYLFILLQLSACDTNETSANKIEELDSIPVGDILTQNPEWNGFRDQMLEFYKKRDYKPAWIEAGRLTGEGRSFTQLLEQLDEYGIPAQQIDSEGTREEVGKRPVATDDVRLTASFFDYYPKLSEGMLDPHSSQEVDWNIEPRSKPDYVQVLDSLLDSSDKEAFQNIEFHQGFQELKRALQTYQKIESEGGWPVVEMGDRDVLVKGDSGLAVQTLSDRLLASNDLTSPATEAVFTTEMQEAVMAFQKRHGLLADGVVGGKTLSMLNLPVEEQIKKIKLNMERWRWIPLHHLKGDYVMINIPEYKLRIYEKDKITEEMKIVVGKDTANTTVFNDVIQKIVLNPYWNIPNSISVAEILPQIQGDVNYLEESNLEVGIDWKFDTLKVDTINWEKLSETNFPYTLRRKPGDNNPLGKIKFIFPNQFAIYLHDTPATGLFDEHERDFSHGCIRLEKPLELAESLLTSMDHLSMRKLQRKLENGKEDEEIMLSEPVPVYMLYFTTWVDEEGDLNFRDDIYEHDEILAELLFGQAE